MLFIKNKIKFIYIYIKHIFNYDASKYSTEILTSIIFIDLFRIVQTFYLYVFYY